MKTNIRLWMYTLNGIVWYLFCLVWSSISWFIHVSLLQICRGQYINYCWAWITEFVVHCAGSSQNRRALEDSTLYAGYFHKTDGVLWSCKPVADPQSCRYGVVKFSLHNVSHRCLQVAHSFALQKILYGRGSLTHWWIKQPTCVACSWWVL